MVVFLEPIALYMTKDLHEKDDQGWLFDYPLQDEHIAFGEVGIRGEGETVILTYANGYYLSLQASKILLDKHQIATKVIDLRWLSPLPIEAILKEVKKAKRILIVDEGRKSASISEGLWTLLLEAGVTQLIERMTGEDCFIPLGNAWQYLLPSRDKIVEAVLKMCKEKERGRFIVS